MSRYAMLWTQASRLRIYNGIYIELDLMPRGGFFNMPKIFAGSIFGDTLHSSYEKKTKDCPTHIEQPFAIKTTTIFFIP